MSHFGSKKSARKSRTRKSKPKSRKISKRSRKSYYTKVIKTKERKVKIGGKTFIVGGKMTKKSVRK